MRIGEQTIHFCDSFVKRSLENQPFLAVVTLGPDMVTERGSAPVASICNSVEFVLNQRILFKEVGPPLLPAIVQYRLREGFKHVAAHVVEIFGLAVLDNLAEVLPREAGARRVIPAHQIIVIVDGPLEITNPAAGRED